MGSRHRPRASTRRSRRLTRAGANIALAGVLALALPSAMALAQDDTHPRLTAAAGPVPLDEGSRPVRVRVPYFEVDLPVVWSERKVAGNPAGYPLCDVAQYLLNKEQDLVLPGQPGTSWIYGHAQPGMLLPLTESYFSNGRQELLGKLIKLQLRDGRLLTYRVSQVASGFDYDIAERPNDRQQRLVLQTSTGTTGASPRLLIAGRLIDAEWTDEPRPVAQPRACWQPPPTPTPKARNKGSNQQKNAKRTTQQTAAPTAAPVPQADDTPDPMTMLLGSGAVLLGATVVAIYVVRRP